MDALRNIVGNIPHWTKRLDELSGQIAQRQIDLAKFAEQHPPADPEAVAGPGTRSLRNKGSTESLKPKDEPAAHSVDVATPPPISEAALVPSPPLFDAIATAGTTPAAAVALASAPAPAPTPVLASEPAQIPSAGPAAGPSTELPDLRPTSSVATDHSPYATPSALQRQTNQVIAAAQAKARATVRKRNRSDSIVSAEGVLPKYRSRTMVLVYYDSYVQSFFEELVKFISASRNLMRKAKMAAKVAQIKRMAELEMPDNEDEDDGELKPDDKATTTTAAPNPNRMTTADAPIEASPPTADGDANQEPEFSPLNYVSTRQMRSYGRSGGMGVGTAMRPQYVRAGARGMYSASAGGLTTLTGGGPQKPDAFDELDKSLEQAQSMCEQAAHQFLRDGDCDEEIANIKRRLTETNELANKELERIVREDPDLAKSEPPKSRSYRVQSMRRDPGSPSSSSKDAAAAAAAIAAGASSPPPVVAPAPVMEASDAKIEVDEGIEDVDWDNMPRPKFVYKSTRMMGRGIS